MLRALLAMRMGRAEATRVARASGRALPSCSPCGAFREPDADRVASSSISPRPPRRTRRLPRRHAGALGTRRHDDAGRELSPGATSSDAVDLLLRTAQKEFPIVDGSGRPRGLLTKDALIGALREAGPASPVLDSMVREVPSLPAWRPLEAGLATLTQAKAPALFVLDDAGRLAGVITPENVGEMMLVRSVRPDFRFRRLARPRVQV